MRGRGRATGGRRSRGTYNDRGRKEIDFFCPDSAISVLNLVNLILFLNELYSNVLVDMEVISSSNSANIRRHMLQFFSAYPTASNNFFF